MRGIVFFGAQVVGNRYFRSDRTVQGIKQRSNASVVFKVKASPILAKGTRSRVGNGKATRFWLADAVFPY